MSDRVRPGPDAGATLVELVVTVAIVGIAFTAILGGMSTSTIASDLHRKQATAETVLRSLAESVKRQPYDCPGSYSTDITVPPAYDARVEQVRYWDGGTPLAPARFGPTPACASDRGLQLVVLSVSTADDRVVERVEILKRRGP